MFSNFWFVVLIFFNLCNSAWSVKDYVMTGNLTSLFLGVLCGGAAVLCGYFYIKDRKSS